MVRRNEKNEYTSRILILILRALAANLVRENSGSSQIADQIREAKLDGSQLSNFPELYELIVRARERPSCAMSDIIFARCSPVSLRVGTFPGVGSFARVLRGGSEIPRERDLKTKIFFSVACDSTKLGESIGVVGECEELGKWTKALRMTTSAQVSSLLFSCLVLKHLFVGTKTSGLCYRSGHVGRRM